MTTLNRQYSFIDQVIMNFNIALQTAAGAHAASTRVSPALQITESAALSSAERQHAVNLMRINHVGEVCAQALYQGQALTAKSSAIKAELENAAQEEQDHLVWCEQRITELGGRVSYLNPFWYTASLFIGAVAGLAGDAISLGFLAETEHQVEQHLTEHLQKLPIHDVKSRAILEQMRLDEIKHAQTAENAGGQALPTVVKTLMRCLSKVMTTATYWI